MHNNILRLISSLNAKIFVILLLLFFVLNAYAMKFNGEEIVFDDDSEYVTKTFECDNYNNLFFFTDEDNFLVQKAIILHPAQQQVLDECIDHYKTVFYKIDTHEIKPSNVLDTINLDMEERIQFPGGILVVNEFLKFKAKKKIIMNNTILQVKGKNLFKSGNIFFDCFVFRSKEKLTLEGLDEEEKSYISKIEIYPNDIQDMSFLYMSGEIDFNLSFVNRQFTVLGVNKIDVIFKRVR